VDSYFGYIRFYSTAEDMSWSPGQFQILNNLRVDSNVLVNAGATTITNAELQQLATIDSTTISTTQWGYVGAMDQAVATTDSPTFVTLNSGKTSPTYSNFANGCISTSSTNDLLWQRSDDMVQVSGRVVFNMNNTGTAGQGSCELAVPLSRGTNFNATDLASGLVLGWSSSNGHVIRGWITSVNSSERVLLSMNIYGGTFSNTTYEFTFTFQYQMSN
jgi:hypothetical protein